MGAAVLGAGLPASLFGLAGCSGGGGNSSGGTPTPIRIGMTGNSKKLKIRGASVSKFGELHPNIPVKYEGVPSDSWPDKLAAMVASGSAPDVINTGGSDMIQYAARGVFEPLDSFIPEYFKADLYDANILGLGKIDGKLYGAPIAAATQGIGYNVSAFKRYGIDKPSTDWTYGDFATVSTEIFKASDKKMHGSHDGGGMSFWFEMYLISQGKQLFGSDGKSLAVSSEDVGNWLDFWVKLRKSGGCVTPAQQAKFTGTEWPDSPMVKGLAAMNCMYVQDLAGGYQALMKDTADLTLPPSVESGGKPGNFPAPSSNLCLNAKSSEKNDAVTFINWFVSDPESAKILKLISGPPASKPALKAVLGLSDLSAVDERVLKYSENALSAASPAPPQAKAGDAIGDLLRRVNEDVGFGKSSVQGAASDFLKQGKALIARA